jgi:hypothetical protein
VRPVTRPRGSAAGALALLLVITTLGGCGGSEQSPAEARRERVASRLRESFSGAQADCILDRADDELLRALDRARALDADATALAAWSDVLVACVTDPDGATTTTTAPADAAPSSSSSTEARSLVPEVTTTTR